MFDNVHHSYMVVLLARLPAALASGKLGAVEINASVTSAEYLRRLTPGEPSLLLSYDELVELSDTKVVPWLDGDAAAEIFETMRDHQRLARAGGWVTGHQEARWDFTRSGRFGRFGRPRGSNTSWRVLMTRHIEPFELVDDVAFRVFVDDLAGVSALGRGLTRAQGEWHLDETHPIIVFRRPSRNDDARTVKAAALPEVGRFHNAGSVHAILTDADFGLETTLALLCYLNTYCCDWWARRFVDRHVTAPVINNLRLPDWTEEQQAQAQTSGSGIRLVALCRGFVCSRACKSMFGLVLLWGVERVDRGRRGCGPVAGDAGAVGVAVGGGRRGRGGVLWRSGVGVL